MLVSCVRVLFGRKAEQWREYPDVHSEITVFEYIGCGGGPFLDLGLVHALWATTACVPGSSAKPPAVHLEWKDCSGTIEILNPGPLGVS